MEQKGFEQKSPRRAGLRGEALMPVLSPIAEAAAHASTARSRSSSKAFAMFVILRVRF